MLEDDQDAKISIKISSAWKELPETKPFQKIVRVRYQVNGKDKMRVGLIQEEDIPQFFQDVLITDWQRLNGVDVKTELGILPKM